jgi:chromatin modification-related protein VID21
MPSVGFFESRQSSQWTIAEDDELRRLVKEYSYNWSLISNCLSSPSLFSSGAERRTPWECFERWIGLEGLPADMSKTQYFRAYHQRLETAQRTVLAQQQAAQQQQQQQQAQQGNNAQAQALVRRRTTQPIRVDRRRASRHLALLDAMRKLAKKRETMLQKQQHGEDIWTLYSSAE